MRQVLVALCLIMAAPAFADAPSLSSDRPAYRVGDVPTFTVTAPSDCFLTLFAIGADGEAGVLLPNRFQPDNRIPAGEPVQIPGKGASFSDRLRRCGDERVFAICGAQDRAIGGIIPLSAEPLRLGVDVDRFLQWVSQNSGEVAQITFPVSEPLRATPAD